MRDMKMPRIIFLERLESYLAGRFTLIKTSFFVRQPNWNGHRATRLGFLLISILSLVACQPFTVPPRLGQRGSGTHSHGRFRSLPHRERFDGLLPAGGMRWLDKRA